MIFVLWMLCMAFLTPIAQTGPPDLEVADFTIGLPGGSFNMVLDRREDLERVTGQQFEYFPEFVDLGIVYDRLLTDGVNFFSDVGERRVNQANFKQGGRTARGIGLGSTPGEVRDAYGDLFWFEEHGHIRARYELTVGDDCYELSIVMDAAGGGVVDLHMNGPPGDG